MGEYGVQLKLTFRVDRVEDPIDAEVPQNYSRFYSIGSNKNSKWQITNNGQNLWHPDEDAIWVRSSKFGMLIQRCIDINAPIISQPLPPTDTRAWANLDGIWADEEIEYKGLESTTGTFPVQIFGQGQPAPAYQAPTPQVAAPPQVNGNAAPPPMATPPPAPAASYVDFKAHWGANEPNWSSYIKSLIQGKDRESARSALMSDSFCQSDSVLTTALADGSFFEWAFASQFVGEAAGVIV